MGRRSAGSPRTTNGARRWRARACVVIGVACVLFAVAAPSASATYARVSAEVRCDRADLRVTPQASWGASGQGDDAGESKFATAAVPEACATQQLDLDLREDCAAGGALVELTNLGPAAETAEISVDRVEVRQLTLPGRASASLLVPAPDRRRWSSNAAGPARRSSWPAPTTTPTSCRPASTA